MPDIDTFISAQVIGYLMFAFLLQVIVSGVCIFVLLWRSWPGLFFHGGWLAAISYWLKSIIIVALLVGHLEYGHRVNVDIWYFDDILRNMPVFLLACAAFFMGDLGLLMTLNRSKNLEQWAALIEAMKAKNPNLRARG